MLAVYEGDCDNLSCVQQASRTPQLATADEATEFFFFREPNKKYRIFLAGVTVLADDQSSFSEG